MGMVIRAIVLDFGGTLADGHIDWDEYHRAIQGLLKALGFSIDMSRLKRAIAAAIDRLERIRARGEELTFEEVYAHALSRLDVPPDEGTLKMIHGLFRQHFETTIYPCVEEVLRRLSKRYKLALLSNTLSDTPRIALQQARLLGYFDVVACSRDLGVRKPNPRAFLHVLKRLGFEAEEAVHVGDRVEADVEGALETGMRAIWVRGADDSSWKGITIRSICELPEILVRLEGP
jgi:putative hydrolase of the HAD superfamily